MELIMEEEHLQYVNRSAVDDAAAKDFLSKVGQSEGGGPDLLSILYRMCDVYVDHLLGYADAERKEQDRKDFLRPAVQILSGLHILYNEKVPTGLMDFIDECERGCETYMAIAYRDEYFRDRGPVNLQWIRGFGSKCGEAQLCHHGVGPIFALAMAWLEACEHEEARDRQRRLTEWEETMSPSVTAALGEALEEDSGKERGTQ